MVFCFLLVFMWVVLGIVLVGFLVMKKLVVLCELMRLVVISWL